MERDDRPKDSQTDAEARSAKGPSGQPPDAELTYDPEMTEGDEANTPEGSRARTSRPPTDRS
jgi:hypothetical protein